MSNSLDSIGIGLTTGAVTAIVSGVTAAGIIGYNIQKQIKEAQEAVERNSKKASKRNK